MNETDVNEPASPFFTVLELFGTLRKESKVLIHHPGDSVAYLCHVDKDSKGPRIIYGCVSATSYGSVSGLKYDVMERSGKVWTNIGPDYLAQI